MSDGYWYGMCPNCATSFSHAVLERVEHELAEHKKQCPRPPFLGDYDPFVLFPPGPNPRHVVMEREE